MEKSLPPISFEDFIHELAQSGWLSVDEIQAFRSRHPELETAEHLARHLVRSGELTRYQAAAIFHRNTQLLRLGNYQILERIGQGGMGKVYKARHRRMDRVVALKVLPRRHSKAPGAVDRFKREVRAAARLQHPNVVMALDADEEDGLHFLVMEYVDGIDLSSYVKQHGPLSPSFVVELVLQAARALEYAHRQGVVHRDIKPSNLLVDASGGLKILDMGIARLEEPNIQADLTATGVILGTLDYMAPEQAMNIKNADERSDMYSLGCSLYFLLSGRCIYPGESPTERIVAHREQAAPSLQVLEGVPPELDEIFQRMVAKRPEDRVSSMGEIVALLEDLRERPCDRTADGSSSRSTTSASDLESFSVDLAKKAETKTPDVRDSAQDTQHWHESPTLPTLDVSSKPRPPRAQSTPWRNIFFVVPGLILILGLLFAMVVFTEARQRQVTQPGSTLSAPATPRNEREKVEQLATSLEPQRTSEPLPPLEPLPFKSWGSNYALEFDGTSSYVAVHSLTLDGKPPLTLELTIWLPAAPVARVEMVAGWCDLMLLTVSRSTRVIGLIAHRPDGGCATSYATPLSDGPVKAHVASVWDGQELRFYLKGELQERLVLGEIRTSKERQADGQGNFALGAGICAEDGSCKPESYFSGIVDEIRVSSCVRYDGKRFAPPNFLTRDSDTIALYHCDEGEGTKLTDCSGNDHHGLINGARWVKVAGSDETR